MTGNIRKLGYTIESESGKSIASIYLNRGSAREYGLEKPLSKSTIGRIERLTYSGKYSVTAALAFGEIMVFIRPLKDKPQWLPA